MRKLRSLATIGMPRRMEMTNFKNAGGQLGGKIATTSKVDTFRQTWEVDLTFQAELP